MEQLFLQVIRLSISATWLILAVLIIRFLFHKAPKRIICILWCMVGLRLVFPFTIESAFSLVPDFTNVTEYAKRQQNADFRVDENNVTVPQIPNALMGVEREESNKIDHEQANNAVKTKDVISVLFTIWMLGAFSMFIYFAVSYCHLSRKIKTAVVYEENVWQSEFIKYPFIFGIVKPKIYIPYHLEEDTLNCVLEHEKIHLKRKDYLIKIIAFLILCIYWFHPFVWLSYFLLCKDIEMACDEQIIADMDGAARKAYCIALLHCSGRKRIFHVVPIGFGEVGVKERIMRIKKYKKPAFWFVIAASLSCIIAAICFLTNPKSNKLTLDKIVQMTEEDSFSKYDFTSFSNGEKNMLDGDGLNYYMSYSFPYNRDTIQMDVSLMREDDTLDTICLTRESNNDRIIIYSRDVRFTAESDINSFLENVYDIHQDLSYVLPDGLTETDYSGDIGYMGGCLFKPDAYETYLDKPVKKEWVAAGMISRYYVDERLGWDGDEIYPVDTGFNHTETEYLGSLDGLCAPAFLMKCRHDIYTLPDWEEVEAKIDKNDIESENEYWYIYFARPGDEIGYVVSLNAKNFTRDEAIVFAETIQYRK